MKDEKRALPIETEPAEYQREDIDARGIIRFTGAIVIITIVAALAMKLMFDEFLARARVQDPPPSPLAEVNQPQLPPLPRLQTAPEAELRQMRIEEEWQLETYGWVDRKAGRVRIPIERAMGLVLERDFAASKSEKGARTNDAK